jgi:hypothetical protein
MYRAATGRALGTILTHRYTYSVDREYHALYMLLLRTRAKAMQDGPITVRFNGRRAIMEDRNGGAIESLWLTTLHEVQYRTIQGDRRIIFGQGGPTDPYNTHLHGGDVMLKSWTGRSRSLWVHCTGGVTEGHNNDWTLNHGNASLSNRLRYKVQSH